MNEPSPTAVVGWNHFNCDPNSTGCNLRGTPTRDLHRLVPGVNRVGRGGRAQKRGRGARQKDRVSLWEDRNCVKGEGERKQRSRVVKHLLESPQLLYCKDVTVSAWRPNVLRPRLRRKHYSFIKKTETEHFPLHLFMLN